MGVTGVGGQTNASGRNEQPVVNEGSFELQLLGDVGSGGCVAGFCAPEPQGIDINITG